MYTNNFIQTYLWKIGSVLTGFLSMMLVIPAISSNQELYGIYAFIISLSLYFTYADIGFVSAGEKYAAEAYAQKDINEETHIIGFTTAVMMLMFLPVCILFTYLSLDPSIIFNDLTAEGIYISGKLFLILGLLLPVQIILQRIVGIIFHVRLLEFILTRIDIFFNLFKLLSIFYFFNGNNYMIVEYFLFCTLITIFSIIVALIYISKRLNFELLNLLKSIKFSRPYFKKVKSLAFASAAITVGFILFYELDLLLIGALLSINDVAIYAAAFTFLNFLRRLWSILYGPISVRLNHFIGLDNFKEAKNLLELVLNFTIPICLIVTSTLIISSQIIVLTWVGSNYLDSILLLQILLLSFSGAYISNLGFHYLVAFEKKYFLYLLAFILPFSFFAYVALFFKSQGLLVFAYAKLFTAAIEFCIYWYGLRNFLQPIHLIIKWIIPFILWLLVTIPLLPYLFNVLNISELKDSIMLSKLLMLIGFYVLFSYAAFVNIFKSDRIFISNIYSTIFKKSLN